MKLIIAGSRPNKLNVGFSMMEHICKHFNFHPFTVDEVVSGCAAGVDEKGVYWASEQKIPVKRFAVEDKDWDAFGKGAGPVRNRKMADYADALLVIWDGKSKGSKNMIEEMERKKKPIYEVILKEPEK